MIAWFTRHRAVWRQAVLQERERLKKKVAVNESDFLPAALEILETPASPAGRAALWGMMAFLLITVLWAIIGKVDIVATASGRVLPSSYVKVIQSPELGVVRDIAVKSGERVEQGQVLIALDSRIAGADRDQAQQRLLESSVAMARERALIEAAAKADAGAVGVKAQPDWPEGTPDQLIEVSQHLLDSQLAEYIAAQSNLKNQLAAAEAALRMTETELEQLLKMEPAFVEQLNIRKELLDKGLNSRLIFLDAQQRLQDHRKNIALDRNRLVKNQADIAALLDQAQQLRDRFRKDALAGLADASQKAELARLDLQKTDTRAGLQLLRSPVAGTVTQLIVHTVGGVVQPGQQLAMVVPEEDGLMVEALVENKDIGFVEEGQEVEVKLEAFPYTRYGVLHGVIERVSADALQLNQATSTGGSQGGDSRETGANAPQTLVFPARVRLSDTFIMVDGKKVPLTPGMAAVVEIKTGKRRLISFFLSPLIKYKSESLRER